MFNDGRLKSLLEQGKKFSANACARSGGVAVRGVLAPLLSPGARIRAQLAPADLQQRPNDGTCERVEPAEPSRPRPAQDMRKHGCRLVVSSMCNRNPSER